MTTATTPDLTPETGEEEAVAQEAQEFLQLAAAYRSLNRAQRRRIAGSASPETRKVLANLERDMALERSPGSMSAILTDGKEKQAPHLDLIDRVFRDIARGHSRKVLITMPPRHGKSRRAARWAPLWYLSRNPGHRVMIASYSADLADDHGRWIRDAIVSYGDQIGLHLHAGSKAANRFDLADADGNRLEGGLVTAGVGGGLTGKGAHLAVVDDPIKDAADAESPTMRRRLWDWWTSVLNTRIEPGGSIIVIQTRWHEQDLAGKILEGEDASDWTCIDLPAICDTEDDPLGRKPGQALWPVRYGRKALEKIRRAVGERVWWSLYMQKPRPLEGGVWKWPWITDNRITVDQAGGQGDTHDETGIIGAGCTTEGHLYVLEDRSANMGADVWGHEACRLAIELQADAFVVEDNFGGDQSAQIIRQAWRDLRSRGETKGMLMPAIVEVHAKQNKRLRAEPIAQLAAQGLIHHVGEFPRLEGQLVTWMPGMDSPDRMDAYVHGLTELADPEQEGLGAQHYNDQRLRGRR
jgi:hypothetical protein